MPDQRPSVFAVIGNSGTGKTTLIERLVPVLRRRGIRVGVVKHAHHGFDLDQPGKNSARFTDTGADVVTLVGPNGTAELRARVPALDEILARLGDLDLVIVEGFRTSSLPRIIAGETSAASLSAGPILAAWRDAPAPAGIPRFGESELDPLASMIFAHFALERVPRAPLFAILGGGEGRRLGGTDKILQPFKGRPLGEWMKDLAAPYATEVVLLSSRHESPVLGLRPIPDAVPDKGPLGGVLAGLREAGPRGLVVMPCDMPRLTAAVVQAIIDAARSGVDAAVAVADGTPIPVLGWYGPGAAPVIEREAHRPQGRLAHAVELLGALRVPIDARAARDVDLPGDLE